MHRQKRFAGLVLAAPVLVGLLVFYIVPFAISVWYSLCRGAGGQFVGLANYAEVLASATFRLAAYNTLRFLLLCVPLVVATSLVLAGLLQKKFAGSTLFRTTLLFPMVVPVASTVMFAGALLGDGGVLNLMLQSLGLRPTSWLHTPAAFWVLVALYLWKNLGYCVILMLAGLNMVPREMYETASIEGAGLRHKLRLITLPMMAPTLFFTGVLAIINAFRSFREALALGGNYPHRSIYMLQHYLQNNFENLSYQHLSVASFLLFVLIFALMAWLFRIQNRHGGDAL